MTVGFRKALFGFNCEDVVGFIEKSNKDFKLQEQELNSKVNSLSTELEALKTDYQKLLLENESVSKELSSFTEKNDEIQRLSDNIGKLYLVAQSNARAIVQNSEKSADIASDEVTKNIVAIDSAHKSLDELKKHIDETSKNFSDEVEALINSLEETKVRISENTESSDLHKDQFEEIYRSLST